MSLSTPAYEDLDLESRIKLIGVVDQFEVAFLADPATRLEDFLEAAHEQGVRSILLLELLGVELECRRRAGQIPMPEEYLLRLPDDAEAVRKAFRVPFNNLTGTRLGKYQLNQLIGRGGMGTVYAATDPVVNRQVAVKILSESLAANQRAHEYLLREAQLVGRLLHPNIVTLFEAGEVDGVCYLVLEHVSGGSAAASLRQNGPFDWVIASRILLDVCQGLVAAHAVGLIHRDIKPANILLLEAESASSASGMVRPPLAKLTDFGLARASEDEACVGTPEYMAPEQFAHGTSNPTTDIYSLGATYYALLTGSPPFAVPTLAEMQQAHRTAPIPDVRKANPIIPGACARIVRRCLAKSPEERYQSAEQVIIDLETLFSAAETTHSSRRRSLVLALAGVAALGLAAGIVAVRTGARTPEPAGPAAPISAEAGSWKPLFNGRDLTGWQICDDEVHGGLETQDRDAVFTVKAVDGEPAVWVSGKKRLLLATLQEYENYHLSLEYRWLPPLLPPDSGVLYHRRIVEQVLVGHEFGLEPPNSGRRRGSKNNTNVNVGVLHQGQIIPGGGELNPNSPLKQNFENAPGKWNQLDLICVGDSALHVLNSRVVLALTRSRIDVEGEEKPLTRGRIMLQSYRRTIAFRRIRIRSISGIPRNYYP